MPCLFIIFQVDPGNGNLIMKIIFNYVLKCLFFCPSLCFPRKQSITFLESRPAGNHCVLIVYKYFLGRTLPDFHVFCFLLGEWWQKCRGRKKKQEYKLFPDSLLNLIRIMKVCEFMLLHITWKGQYRSTDDSVNRKSRGKLTKKWDLQTKVHMET